MARIKNVFTEVMDKETDRAFVKQGFTRHVENIRFHTNNGNDGIGKNIKGTQVVSNATEGRTDLKCITALHNPDLDVIYYYLASTSGLFSKVLEYNIASGNTTTILHDTLGILDLDKDGFITGINEIDGLLFWSEWGKNPRRINVERAKTYGTNGFSEDDLKVIVKPPFQKLKLTLENSTSQEENFIEEKFLSFSYRYRYLDGEYSVLAPFTNVAFEPKDFRYSFTEQSTISMINKFNQVKIEFNTGNERVVEIQLIFRESQSSNAWIIDDFNKELLGYGHNEIKEFIFSNPKVKRGLPKEILDSIMDNVPLTAKSQELIEGRLLYSYYKENYDLIDENDAKIEIDFSLEKVSLPNTIEVEGEDVPSLQPKRTCKSDRDYEVSMVYGDDDGRITTNLNSKTNTLKIPIENSVTQNSIDVILNHKPPKWAKYFRFFIRQSKKGYETIIPTLFFFQGSYIYFYIQSSDRDKVSENDYLIVKADTDGAKTQVVKLKVLEKEKKEADFINENDGGQPEGWYIKTSILDKPVIFDPNSYSYYRFDHYDQSENADIISGESSEYLDTLFKGDTLDDLTPSSSFSDSVDLRYEIEIIDTSGLVDTFQWRTQQVDGTFSVWDNNGGLGYNITGALQTIDSDLDVTFGAITGHSINDKWLIKKNVSLTLDEDNRSFAKFVYPDSINIGTIITLKYYSKKEKSSDIDRFLIQFISNNNYENLEEWFYGDNIFSQLIAEPDFDQTIDKFSFRKVNVSSSEILGNTIDTFEISPTGNNFMMMIESRRDSRNSSRDVYSDVYIEVRQLDYLPVFETEPKDQPEDIYFEIGKNYKIVNGFHTHITDDFETELDNIPTDQSQTAVQPLRVKLDWFNAFSYGNAVESYKIRDQFNAKGIDVGVRVLTSIIEEYKEVTRKADITWSDVYNDESDYNGLNTFNLSLSNFVKLDKENGSIQKLLRFNNNIIVFQEDAIGIMPYNRQIFEDVQGNQVVGISTNILDERAYRPYNFGKHGVSQNPESIVRIGSRIYLIDEQRGDLLRIANDGITTLNQYFFEYEFSQLMRNNKKGKFVAGYDPVHDEYVINIPSESSCLVFKENKLGFPQYLTFEPDFMLNANNEFYAWKKGIMYKMYATEQYNNFFGEDFLSKIKFFSNQEFGIEKIAHAIGIESTHSWLVNISSKLTSRTIPKESFIKKEDYWFSEIMGNTNGNTESSAVFGLGEFEIINGEIFTTRRPETMSIGDKIKSTTLLFSANEIIALENDRIILQNPITTVSSLLYYEKDQDIDGNNIRGDVFEIEMTNDDTEKVELRAVNLEVSKSDYS